ASRGAVVRAASRATATGGSARTGAARTAPHTRRAAITSGGTAARPPGSVVVATDPTTAKSTRRATCAWGGAASRVRTMEPAPSTGRATCAMEDVVVRAALRRTAPITRWGRCVGRAAVAPSGSAATSERRLPSARARRPSVVRAHRTVGVQERSQALGIAGLQEDGPVAREVAHEPFAAEEQALEAAEGAHLEIDAVREAHHVPRVHGVAGGPDVHLVDGAVARVEHGARTDQLQHEQADAAEERLDPSPLAVEHELVADVSDVRAALQEEDLPRGELTRAHVALRGRGEEDPLPRGAGGVRVLEQGLAAEQLALGRREDAAAHDRLQVDLGVHRHHRAALADDLLARVEGDAEQGKVGRIDDFVVHGFSPVAGVSSRRSCRTRLGYGSGRRGCRAPRPAKPGPHRLDSWRSSRRTPWRSSSECRW